MPQDGMPQDAIPQDGIPQDGIPQDAIPQNRRLAASWKTPSQRCSSSAVAA
jgi:hypothetical protein